MQKVGLFRSIHIKFVLINVLLILIAMQIIGFYFARELEETLKTNFTESIDDRMNLVEFSVREEMTKETDNLELELRLADVLSNFNSQDINEVQVINSKYTILATSVWENESIVGQRSSEDIVRRSITSETPYDTIYLDENSSRPDMGPCKTDQVSGWIK